MKIVEVAAKTAFIKKYLNIAEDPKRQTEQCCFLDEFLQQMNKL